MIAKPMPSHQQPLLTTTYIHVCKKEGRGVLCARKKEAGGSMSIYVLENVLQKKLAIKHFGFSFDSFFNFSKKLYQNRWPNPNIFPNFYIIGK